MCLFVVHLGGCGAKKALNFHLVYFSVHGQLWKKDVDKSDPFVATTIVVLC
jgi:hypothetical protein